MSARIGSGWVIRMAGPVALVALGLTASVQAAQVRGTVVDREGKAAEGAKV